MSDELPLAIEDIPRVDRGSIWGRAEEIQRHNPHMTAPAAMFRAMRDYEEGVKITPAEAEMLKVLKDNPESMFRRKA